MSLLRKPSVRPSAEAPLTGSTACGLRPVYKYGKTKKMIMMLMLIMIMIMIGNASAYQKVLNSQGLR